MKYSALILSLLIVGNSAFAKDCICTEQAEAVVNPLLGENIIPKEFDQISVTGDSETCRVYAGFADDSEDFETQIFDVTFSAGCTLPRLQSVN